MDDVGACMKVIELYTFAFQSQCVIECVHVQVGVCVSAC